MEGTELASLLLEEDNEPIQRVLNAQLQDHHEQEKNSPFYANRLWMLVEQALCEIDDGERGLSS